ETMLGDTGVAVHPNDPRFADLVGKSVRLPLADRLIPIIADEHADPETGTGAVKVTPAHDFADFEVGRRHGLALLNIFDQDARLNDAVPVPYRGLDRFAAREKVVADLAVAGLLDKVEDHTLMVPHHDLTGTGAVKVTPAHDFADFEVGRRHGLALLNIFDQDARLNDAVPVPYRGLDRFAAREKVVADLAVAGLLDKVEDHTLMVPHHD